MSLRGTKIPEEDSSLQLNRDNLTFELITKTCNALGWEENQNPEGFHRCLIETSDYFYCMSDTSRNVDTCKLPTPNRKL